MYAGISSKMHVTPADPTMPIDEASAQPVGRPPDSPPDSPTIRPVIRTPDKAIVRPLARAFHLPLIKALAAASILTVLAIASFKFWRHSPKPPVYEQIATSRGQRKQVQLPDGTRVWMAPGSELKYPAKFTDDREVFLEGEAFFDVSHDPAHSFIIHAGSIDTRVLGTSFNVRAYGDSTDAEITLVTGKVSISTENNPTTSTELAANQQAVYSARQGTLKKQDYPGANEFLARRNGQLIYKGVALERVIADIRLFYNIDISFPPTMRKCAYYGKFNSTDNPRLIPQEIAFAFNASAKEQGNGLWNIEGGNCK
jgi:ferric-dicitrate binding protein FerR (iron transport regulator)